VPKKDLKLAVPEKLEENMLTKATNLDTKAKVKKEI